MVIITMKRNKYGEIVRRSTIRANNRRKIIYLIIFVLVIFFLFLLFQYLKTVDSSVHLKAILIGIVYGFVAKISKKIFLYIPIALICYVSLSKEIFHFLLNIGVFTLLISAYISYKINYMNIFRRIKGLQ